MAKETFGILSEEGKRHSVGSIFGIGRNYEAHAKELANPVPQGEPVVFLKTASSLRDLETKAEMAFIADTYHHEAELVIRIGKNCTLNEKLTWNAISHIGLGLDLTRRQVQDQLKAKGLPWTTAKSFAGSAVMTPMVQYSGGERFEFELLVNGTLRQRGDTAHMIFDVPFILTWLAQFNYLQEGDLIYTGTPAGVGPINKGDRFTLNLQQPARSWTGVL